MALRLDSDEYCDCFVRVTALIGYLHLDMVKISKSGQEPPVSATALCLVRNSCRIMSPYVCSSPIKIVVGLPNNFVKNFMLKVLARVNNMGRESV